MKSTSSKQTYAAYADKRAKKSPLIKDLLAAFAVGGGICVLGQALRDLYLALGFGKEDAGTLVCVTVIFLTALSTGLGFFDRLAKLGGAGTLVPITGFANAVVSPALDNKAEGFVPGLGAKIFIIAGPVILYGTLSSAIFGVLYYLWKVVSKA